MQENAKNISKILKSYKLLPSIASFIHKNTHSGQVSREFPIIVNLNLTFALNVTKSL